MKPKFIGKFEKVFKESENNTFYIFYTGFIDYSIMFLGSQRNRICVNRIIHSGNFGHQNCDVIYEVYSQDVILSSPELIELEASCLIDLCFDDYSKWISKLI